MVAGQRPAPPKHSCSSLVDFPCVEGNAKETLTTALDKFLKDNAQSPRTDVVLKYVQSIGPSTNLTQLLQAQLAYLWFHGEECPLFYASATDEWYVWDQKWRASRIMREKFASLFRTEGL